ncbi:YbaK/EbsC family protein [Dictyobacter arantiisoli]|uniref:Cys-tRNA(Pro)/cys-tRNA(Cys) deacylase n=1 Tax=Dictyobacter arantiisoli TaxID=2014874 RepID=A0A5A5TJQ5_9CHLR|nr:YbaK/EbsC family protein [Dictyobacter arantiisoli]GCF11485.1 cys-tRNA(pro)/cys-tRNA(cys) deacylase [Dictyobacter arantiisoli]
MVQELTARAKFVQEILQDKGYSSQVIELAESTRTAKDAAQAIGCQVAQIVKSLIFTTRITHKPVLVVASGSNRVNEKQLGTLIGEPIERASPDFVRTHTGYAVGGVAPIGHPTPIQTFIDQDLLQYTHIWAAAGTPFAVFQLTPQDLQKMTGGQVISII